MSDDPTNKRRVLVATIAVVALIGLGGVTIALLVGDGTGSAPGAVSTPGASVDPLTVEGQCRSDAVAKFAVTADPKAAPQFTATGAVEKWVDTGENSQSTNIGENTKLVSISKVGELPRVVLTVERKDGAWAITQTAGCLVNDSEADSCNARLALQGADYARGQVTGAAAVPGGKFLGNGELTFPPSATLDSCQNKLAGRGAVAPVSAYAEQKTAVIVADDAGISLFR